MPQGSVFGPIIYLLYTADLPTPADTSGVTFVDDMEIFTAKQDEENSVRKLQVASNSVGNWNKEWSIKFTNKKIK